MRRQFQRRKENFICEHCDTFVKGNGYTNHCPECLWSKHVDIQPGDRAAECLGTMEPVTIAPKTGSGLEGARILHRCKVCGYEKWNESSSNDSSEALLKLFSTKPF
ncbi:MAG: RNHCP domain-containing protein [Bdellovibrionota bacterium]|jgi:hypothetical protein